MTTKDYNSSSEKVEVEHVSAPGSIEHGSIFDEAATKKLLRRLDWHLVPFLSLLYLYGSVSFQCFAWTPMGANSHPRLSFLDRTNIGNARLAGLEEDLGMTGLQYNVALAVFFPWYVIAEVPSNIMMKRTSPSKWLCIIMVAWGLCMFPRSLLLFAHSAQSANIRSQV